MKKVFSADIQLQEILNLAQINSDFIEVTIQNGIAIIQTKRLCCVRCGCTDENKLAMQDLVLVCVDCLRRDNDASNI
jgi:hypothetical protein